MSLTITVRPNGATSGGDTHTLPSEGDNGNQEIDTRAEAEAALTHLPENSTSTVVIGERSYTRAQLIEIRDRNATPAAPVGGGTVMGDGASHGFFLEGQYAGGLGDRAHSGGGVRLGYEAGIPLLNGNTRLTLRPLIGLDVGHYSAAFSTPGGEAVDSAYTRYGGIFGADLRLVPNILDHRLGFGIGGRFGVGALGTADSATVSLPPSCTPGDFGRGECEPDAGPRIGNAGTRGLMNFDQGSARGTSGAYLYAGIPLTVSAEFLRGNWGNMSAVAGFEPGFTQLLPSDGHGFGFWSLAGSLGIRGSFGGSAVERPARREEPAGPNAITAPDAAIAQGEGYSVAAPEGGWRAGDQVLLDGTALTDPAVPTSGNAAYLVPAARLATPGPHTIVVRYTRNGRVNERTTNLTVNAPTPAAVDGSASANGFTLAQTLRVNRTALVPGQPPAPLNIGSIVSEASIPAGMKVEIRIDNERAGTPIDLVRDGRTQLTIPATIGDGSHSVEFRIVDSAGSVRHRFVGQPIVIGPGTATLSAASIPSNPPGGGHYYNDPIRVTITSDVATRARITVGSHTEDVNLVVGVNTISMAGNPRSWTTGGAAGRSTHTVRVQPLDAASALTGTAVDAGSVVIRRAGGGHGRPTAPARPPRL